MEKHFQKKKKKKIEINLKFEYNDIFSQFFDTHPIMFFVCFCLYI